MRTRRVLLLFSASLDNSSDRLLRGIAHFQSGKQNWKTLWDYNNSAGAEPERIERGYWDGIISRHTDQRLVNVCRRLKVPLIDLNDNCPKFSDIPKVRPNNATVGRLAAEYFISRGFRHFAFCGFSSEIWSESRRHGFREHLAQTARTIHEFGSDYLPSCAPEWIEAEVSAIADWLISLPRPIAIMTCNDLRAQQVTEAAQQAGLSVPDDLAILGCNNDEVRCSFALPPLSSIPLSYFRAGFRAAEILDAIMEGRSDPHLDEQIDPLDIVTRQSTDILAVTDPELAKALELIHASHRTNLTVAEVSRHAGLARTQLEQRFRRVLGRSPSAEIRRTQVARIRNLLQDTDLPLKVIAERVGFDHVEYMSVFFKKAMGEAPGQYRSKVRVSAATGR